MKVYNLLPSKATLAFSSQQDFWCSSMLDPTASQENAVCAVAKVSFLASFSVCRLLLLLLWGLVSCQVPEERGCHGKAF